MKGLILHKGAVPATLEDLARVTIPQRTASYAPVGHAEFVDVLRAQLAGFGYSFEQAAYGLARDGGRMFGLATLLRNDARALGLGTQYQLTMGFRSSLDKSMAPSVAFGSFVFVCDNMAFTGEVALARKQTTYISRDLPGMLAAALGKLGRAAANQEARFAQYQAATLSQRDADHAIVDMLRVGAVNTQRVERVVREYDNPSYDHGSPSVWRLFNAATEALKDAPIVEMPRRTIALQGICDTLADVKLVA